MFFRRQRPGSDRAVGSPQGWIPNHGKRRKGDLIVDYQLGMKIHAVLLRVGGILALISNVSAAFSIAVIGTVEYPKVPSDCTAPSDAL